MGLPAALAGAAVISASLLDILIGIAVAVRWRPGLTAAVQLATMAVYTLLLTIAQPELWAGLYGPLLKNLPVAAAILALWATEDDR
jgi:hypothetical protein